VVNCLFPYPVAELREIADEVGAYLFYAAAHLGLFLAAGEFQDPRARVLMWCP
jgi:glycine/serine hydroxymethyltransferase